MAWSCSALSNKTLVHNLEKAALVTTPAVIDSLLRVDRGWFVTESFKDSAYMDQPLSIGYGATISAPHMHAIMLEILAPFLVRKAGDAPKVVLDIGSGSGYLTAVLADLSGEGSRVVGVEHVKELQERSLNVARRHFQSWVDEGRLTFIHSDGRDLSKLFDEHLNVFDAIHVGAAAKSVPQNYLEALRAGGCLVIPVGEENGTQFLRVYTKTTDGSINVKSHGGVRFVPLTSLAQQRKRWC